jgi:hypothetical protein
MVRSSAVLTPDVATVLTQSLSGPYHTADMLWGITEQLQCIFRRGRVRELCVGVPSNHRVFLRFWLGLFRYPCMRMLSRRREAGILRGEFFDLSFQVVNLGLHACLHLGHLTHPRFNKRPHCRSHLGEQLRRYLRLPCPARDVSNSRFLVLYRPIPARKRLRQHLKLFVPRLTAIPFPSHLLLSVYAECR